MIPQAIPGIGLRFIAVCCPMCDGYRPVCGRSINCLGLGWESLGWKVKRSTAEHFKLGEIHTMNVDLVGLQKR